MNTIPDPDPDGKEQSTPRDDEAAEGVALVGEAQRRELIINCLENIDI